MKTSFVLALSLLAALPSAFAASACTPDELEAISAAVVAQSGIIRTCELDTGYTLFPFSTYPTGDQQKHVCMGRSCPTAISNLNGPKLPECLIAVDGSALVTVADFLKNICVFASVDSTTSTPSSDAVPSDASSDEDDGSDSSADSSSASGSD